jgi:hypothetical protein
MTAQRRIVPLDAAAQVWTVLLERGAVTRGQLQHSERVRARLREHSMLLNRMLELGYFDKTALEHHLRGCASAIPLGALLVELGGLSPSELHPGRALHEQHPKPARAARRADRTPSRESRSGSPT